MVNAPVELAALRRNPKVEEAPLQGELMLFDSAASKFFVLNRTMAFVWRHCDGTHTFPQVVERLQHEFADVEPVSARAELEKALEDLVSLGLVVDEGGTAA
jgi:hypothetical protein